MSEILLRYLADNTNYCDFIRGIDRLTSEQKEVLFARLQAEIGKHAKVGIKDKNFEKIVAVRSIESKTDIKKMTNKPKSVIECCLHCGSIAIKKHGTTKGGVQRYVCKDCGKTFSENYGLITHYTHLSEWQWQEVVRATVSGDSLTTIAKNIGTSTSTAWTCRMKIYQTIQNIYCEHDKCDGLIEADGKYLRVSFKGCKDKNWFIDKLGRLPRHHMSRADRTEYIGDDYERLFKENPHLLKEMIFSSQKRLVGRDTIDANHQHICILTAIDHNNNIYIEPATAGTAKSQDVYDRLTQIVSRDSVLITDDHHSYKMFCRKERIEHVIIESEIHVAGAYSLSRVNSLHSGIERFLGSKEYLPATKYIDLYLKMFWWLQKNKDCSTKEMTDNLFRIMTGHVDNSVRADMSRVTIRDLVSRKLPIDTKGFY